VKHLILFLLLIVPISGWADTDAQIRQLEKALLRVQQETQFTYQQFIMTQEMRRNEIQEVSLPISPNTPGASVPIPLYEDFVQRNQEKQVRIQQYTADLDRLYMRYKELENEKILLVEKINELEQNQEEE